MIAIFIFGYLFAISSIIFCAFLTVNLITLIFLSQFCVSPIILIYSFLIMIISSILFNYFIYLEDRKNFKGLKLSAKQIIQFFNVNNNNWKFTFDCGQFYFDFGIKINYKNKKIMTKTFFDYIIIILFHLFRNFQQIYRNFPQIRKEKKREKEQQKLVDLEEARFTAKLIEEDIKKELKKSNEDLNKALKENEIILNRLAKERR